MTVFWLVWFRFKYANPSSNRREHLISTLWGSFVAMFIVRVLTNVLPFRNRPILEEANHLVQAYGLNVDAFDHLTSFPSDHATLFYGLSVGFFYVSKRLGWATILYTTVVIALPRMYLGLHYLTDIVGGAIIGITVVVLANTIYFKKTVSDEIYLKAQYHKGVFYTIFFLVSFQIAEMFESSRSLVSFLIHLIKS